MLDTHYPQITDKKLNDVEISLQEPISKINLRGKSKEFFAKAGKVLSLILPNEANTSSFSENFNAIWLSPDEWMVFSNEASHIGSNDYQIENLLNKSICKTNLGAVTDVTDQFVLINLKGDKIYELFETGSPFNFNDFRKKKGSVTQTILAKIDVIIQNESQNDVNLFVRRSFSQHLFSWMNDSASRL